MHILTKIKLVSLHETEPTLTKLGKEGIYLLLNLTITQIPPIRLPPGSQRVDESPTALLCRPRVLAQALLNRSLQVSCYIVG